MLDELRHKLDAELLGISGVTGQGLRKLAEAMWERVQQVRQQETEIQPAQIDLGEAEAQEADEDDDAAEAESTDQDVDDGALGDNVLNTEEDLPPSETDED